MTDPFDPMWPGAGAPTVEAWWRVTAAGADDTLVATATTDADGWARFDALPDGAFDVTAHAKGFAVRGAQVLSPPVRDAPSPTILLDAGHAIRGRVVSEDGAAIAGTLVVAVFTASGTARWQEDERPLVARTDDKGGFRIDGMPEGAAVLHACPPGTWFDRCHLVEVPRETPVEIRLPLFALDAVVKDERTGAPVADAPVFFSTSGFHMSNMLVRATTDAAGRFRLRVPGRWLGPGQIVAPGYLLGLHLDKSMENPPNLERLAGRTLELRAVPGARVRGVVRDPAGPVASAIVTATWLEGFDTPDVRARSGPDGSFELLVWPGLVHVAARRSGTAEKEDPELDVLLATGKDGSRGIVEIPPAGRDGISLFLPAGPRAGTITGRVVTAGGVPVDAWPTVAGEDRRREPRTAIDGAFEIEGVPAGDARLAVRIPGGDEVRSDPVRVEDGKTTARVDFIVPGEPLARVEGRVVGREGPAYVQGTYGRRFPVAADGSFALDTEVLAGEVSLGVVGPDGREGLAKVKCPKGGRASAGEVALEEPQFADFRVVTDSGEPVADATASLYFPPGSIACGPFELAKDLGTPADREGRIRIRLPRDDDFEIHVRAPGLSGLNISYGYRRDLVVLKPFGAMAGQARFADGKPAAGCRVEVSTGWGDEAPHEELEAITDAEGRFRIDGLASAKHHVLVESGASGPSIAPRRQDLMAPNTALDLVVEPALAIAGRVVDVRGRPVADAEVEAHGSDDSPQIETRTDAQGRFRLAGVPEGKYAIQVSRDGLWPDGTERGVAAGAGSVVVRAETGYRITGRLVDGEGTPRAGWVVEAERKDRGGCRDHRARTDGLGRFVLDELEGGFWDLKVGRWGHLDPQRGKRIRAGAEDIVLVLR